eukprot:comp15537_c0_seq1/m.12585 comp15537_c0_seq1/g.12585  ORF comp15537_c0_seq1/g.12585 comp15537_c0_seq1/m.12585 type:complete len:884 (-) comp15537_c0_seq1:404-3055(-)
MHLILVSLAAATTMVAAVPLAEGVTQQLIKDNIITAKISADCDKYRDMTLRFCYEESPDDVVEDITKCFASIMKSESAKNCTQAEKQTVMARLSADLSCVDDFSKLCSAKCKAECTCSLAGADVAKCGCSRAKCSDCLLGCVGANEAELTKVQCSKDNLIPFVEDTLSECPACQARAVAYCQAKGPTVGECLETQSSEIVKQGLCSQDEVLGVKADYCRDAADDDEMNASCGTCQDAVCRDSCGKKLLVKAGCLKEDLNFDTDNDGVTEDCEKLMEAKCKPEEVARTYAKCVLDPTNQLTEECTMTELVTFTRNYCKARAEVAMGADNDCKSVCAIKNEACKACVLKITNAAGCDLLPVQTTDDIPKPPISPPIVPIKPITPPIVPIAPQVNPVTPPSVVQPIAQPPKQPLPATTPTPVGDVDLDNDGITDDCAAKVMEVCDPAKNADTYDTCVAAYVCDFNGKCTSKELMKLFTGFCGLRKKVVEQICAKVCATSPGPDCNDCKEEAYLSAGCANAERPAPIIAENANKLDGECTLAERAGINADYIAEKLDKANDDDFKNDQISDTCAESVQKVCEPTTKMDSYDECIAANVCKFQGKCKQVELFRFTTQYCVTKMRVARQTCKGNTNIGCLRNELLKGGCRLYLNGKVGPAPTIELDIAKLDKTCNTVQIVRDQLNMLKPDLKDPKVPFVVPNPDPKKVDKEPEPPKMIIDKAVDQAMQDQIAVDQTSKNVKAPEEVLMCKISENDQVQEIVKIAKGVAAQIASPPAVNMGPCLDVVTPKCEKSVEEGCVIKEASNVGAVCTPAAVALIKYKYCTNAIAVGSKVQKMCRQCTCGVKVDEKTCPGGSGEACVKKVLTDSGCNLGGAATTLPRGVNFRSQGR